MTYVKLFIMQLTLCETINCPFQTIDWLLEHSSGWKSKQIKLKILPGILNWY